MGKAEEDESIHLLLIVPSNTPALLKVYTNSCTFTEESQKLNYPTLGTATASPAPLFPAFPKSHSSLEFQLPNPSCEAAAELV